MIFKNSKTKLIEQNTCVRQSFSNGYQHIAICFVSFFFHSKEENRKRKGANLFKSIVSKTPLTTLSGIVVFFQVLNGSCHIKISDFRISYLLIFFCCIYGICKLIITLDIIRSIVENKSQWNKFYLLRRPNH